MWHYQNCYWQIFNIVCLNFYYTSEDPVVTIKDNKQKSFDLLIDPKTTTCIQ